MQNPFKLTGLKSIFTNAVGTFIRFPLVLLCAILGAGVAIYIVDLDSYYRSEISAKFYHLLIVSSLGLTLFLSITFFCESINASFVYKLILNVVAALLLIIYYFLLPNTFEKIEVYRYFLFNIALHLLVSFAPFINQKNSINGFWQFNKHLFLRILLSALYSGVLYIGLCIALLAIDTLFGLSINSKHYFNLWISLAGVFNTWFFLSGIEKNSSELNNDTSYPKGLKIFTQFVLLPLVTIYLIILYAYLIKIILSWQLPQGWVSYMVIALSVLGILSILLIYPIKNNTENSWIRLFSKSFYIALYPLICLLIVSIGKRVSDYGITENRYYILLVAIWLAFMAGYFLISKTKNIKLIPISLCLIALLSSFGPLSSFTISKNSQLNLLKTLLIKDGILVDGKIVKPSKALPNSENFQLSSIIRYFETTHGLLALQPLFTVNLDSLFKISNKQNEYTSNLTKVHKLLGIKVEYYLQHDNAENFYFYASQNTSQAKLIKGYDYLVNLYFYTNSNPCSIKLSASDSLNFDLDSNTQVICVKRATVKLLEFNVNTLLNKLKAEKSSTDYDSSPVDKEKLVLVSKNDSISGKLYFLNISGDIINKKYVVTNINAEMYLKWRE